MCQYTFYKKIGMVTNQYDDGPQSPEGHGRNLPLLSWQPSFELVLNELQVPRILTICASLKSKMLVY
jgi:hypothetical protein